MINDIKKTAKDIQQLSSNASHLGNMSEEPAFRAMETRVHDIYESYTELMQDATDQMDTLQQWG